MNFLSNISSINNSSNNRIAPDAPPIFKLPKEILDLIYGHLNSSKDFVQFGSTCHKFYYLTSNSLLSAPLWKLFLCKDFPDSCSDLKSESKSLTLYKRLTNVLHNMKAGRFHLQTLNHRDAVKCMTILDDMLISGSWDHTIKIWDLNTGNEIRTLNGHHSEISCMITLGDMLISGSVDHTIKIWDLQKGKEIRTLNGHQNEIECMTIFDGMLISGSADRTIKVWNLNTGKEIWTLRGHQKTITCMTILDGMLISGSVDHTIKIWDLQKGEEIRTLNGHAYGITCKMILDDMLISGSTDSTIKIWDLKTGQEPQTLTGHKSWISCMTILDGMLISGSWDHTIKIWDLQKGEEIRTLNGHECAIHCMTILDGKLVSGSYDGTIKIWDIKTGQELQTLNGHKDRITCMKAFDGKLVSGSDDSTLKIWDFNFPSLQKEKAVIDLKQVLKEKLGEDLPLLLIDLGIVTKEAYSEKLKCTPNHLSNIGICSPADLHALGLFKNSFHFDYLKVIPEEDIGGSEQPQDMAHIKKSEDTAFAKKGDVFLLLEKLLNDTEKMVKEAEQGALFYETGNIWIAFQNKLKSVYANLDMKCQTRRELLSLFSQTSYANIVEQMNALIDEFQSVNREHQIALLSTYVNQFGILKVWDDLYKPQGIKSLSTLLGQRDIAPQDPFRMGI